MSYIQSVDNFNKGLENLRKFGEDIQKQFDSINKSLQPFLEVTAKIQEIAKIFEKTIYLTPETYKFFLSLNVQISGAEIDRKISEGELTEDDIYTVYTMDNVGSKVKTTSFKVTKDVAKAIKLLIKDKPQYMFLETEKIVFDEEEPSLSINGFKIGLKKGTNRYDLCKYMFKGKRPKKMPWELENLVAAIGEDYYSSDNDWYEVIYRKYRAFNDLIEENLGYEKFFIVKNTQFAINPMYVYLLKS